MIARLRLALVGKHAFPPRTPPHIVGERAADDDRPRATRRRHRPRQAPSPQRGRLRRRTAALRGRRRDGRRPGRRDRGEDRRLGAARVLRRDGRRRADQGGEPARLPGSRRGRGTLRDGYDDHRGGRRGRFGADRARRRLARLPHPRRGARAADRGPLPGCRARPQRQALPGGGGRPPAALGDHAHSRHRPGRRRRHLLGGGTPGRRLLHLLGRPDDDGRRQVDPRDRPEESREPRPGRARVGRTPRTRAAARTTSRSSSSRSARKARGGWRRRRRCPR